MFRDGREFDDEQEEKLFIRERLTPKGVLSDIEAEEFVRETLQEIDRRLLSEDERDEIIRKFNRKFAAERNKTQTELVETDDSKDMKKYTVNMWIPEIDGEPIESYDHLLETVQSRSPGFFKRTDASKLLESAKLHLDLYHEYQDREFLKKGEVAELSRTLEKNPTTLKRYLREGVMPKMYYWLNMVPRDERERKLEGLELRLNGITTHEEYDRRFKTLYFYDEMTTTPDHKQKDEFARKFLTFIDEYRDSGMLVDICKKLEIGKSTANAWFDGTQLPTRIAYASLIPEEEPREGCKWLPMKLNHITNLPENFIQVPVEIRSPRDIMDVLEAITPLEMKDYEEELGEMSQENAFMYLIGLMVSDGSFRSDVSYSASANLFVSKKYSWGSTLGKGFCYTMGKIGLSAKRDTDQERVRENGKVDKFKVYNSEASPVLMWMKKALLGLDASETKKEVAIKADWILEMPHDWKVAFIQGLADGDGHASIPRFDTAIATNTNKKFFKKLLSSVGIASRFTDHHVKIGRYNDILKAKELPFFRFASGRQQILNDISEIIKLRPKGRLPIPEDERRLIMELYRTGLSKGDIVEKLWYEHGLARTTAMIDTLIRRENKKNAHDK